MTIFKNGSVFFLSLFGKNYKRRSDKQLGRISEAINTLNIINEDIAISVEKDHKRIHNITKSIVSKEEVRDSNWLLARKLRRAL